MSHLSTPTQQTQLSFLPELPSEKTGITHLPVEIVQYILQFVTESGCNYQHLVSCSFVCKLFRSFCLELCSRERPLLMMGRMQPASFPAPIPFETTSQVQLMYIRFLAVDNEGRHYYKNNERPYQIYIINSSGEEQNFSVQCLDLCEAAYPTSLNLSHIERHKKQLMHEIVDCCLTDKGFIIITECGASVWEHSPEGPQFRGFFTPYTKAHCDFTIRSYTYVNQVLYLAYARGIHRLDLSKEDPQVESFTHQLAPYCRLHTFNNQPFLLDYDRNTGHKLKPFDFQSNEETGEMEFLVSEDSIPLKDPIDRVVTVKKWTLLDAGENSIIEPENLREQLAVESTQKWKDYLSLDSFCSMCENFFFHFERESGKLIKAIHIPTQIDYAKEFLPLIKPYIQESYKILALRVNSTEGQLFLHLLLLQNDPNGNESLSTVSIPLVKKKVQPVLVTTPEIPAPEPELTEIIAPPEPKLQTPLVEIRTPPREIPKKIEVSKAKPMDSKAYFVAGGVFLLITAVWGTILILWHPGTVIYRGSGLILTVPALLTLSLGMSFSLGILAIGSYTWWKNHPAGLLRS